MKKRKKTRDLENPTAQNPVAKFAHQFNKAHTFKDKSKYCRNAKHKKLEPLAMLLINNMANGFLLFLNRKFVR